MVNVMVNTIALEPNRWTPEKIPHKDVDELLPKMAEAGFTAIEMWQFHVSGKSLDEVKATRRLMDELGLTCPVIGAYPQFHLEGDEAEAEAETQMGLLDRAEILGAPVIKMFLGRVKGSEISDAQMALTEERVARWSEAAKARGIRFCAELHGGTLFDPEETGAAFLAKHPELEMAICYQPYQWDDTQACMDLAGRYAGWIMHVHLQGHDADFAYCPLSESAIDYTQILAKIQAENPGVTYGVEFVRGGMGPAEKLDYGAALADARLDKDFVEGLLNG
ncbi:MAG: sugar phosphate isomerase/epimerase family protein [Planctomycetota bacterium]